MKIIFTTLLLIFFTLIGCKREITSLKNESMNNFFEKENLEYPDSLIIDFAYNGEKLPGDFFRENLSNVFLNYIGEYVSENNLYLWHEFSVSNKNKAKELVYNRLVELNFDSTKLMDGNHNKKYFEFIYPGYLFQAQKDFVFRVHNSEYFEGVYYGYYDSSLDQIIKIGKCNFELKTKNAILELYDRLWYFKFVNYVDWKVLKRYIVKKLHFYLYVIYYTTMVRGDYGEQDIINLFKSEFLFDINTGKTLIKNQRIKKIYGKYNYYH